MITKHLPLILSLLILPLSLSAATPATPPQPSPIEAQQEFNRWLTDFRVKALKRNISPEVFDAAFANITPDTTIIRSDENQPEFVRPIWQYLESAISPWRVARGKALLAEHRTTLDAIESQYNVDRNVLIAIWGLESNFGRNTGSKNIIRSLATLAHQGRRADFWEQQLIAALEILQNGDIEAANMLGSWAGAMGQTQFMPTTFLDYAVDFDGDGRRDIWNSPADALASAANYLKRSGWKHDQAWGYEVRLPTLFNFEMADGAQTQTIAQWLELGVIPRENIQFTDEQLALEASIFLPAGYRGPAYLQLSNFHSILKYNRALSYALAVGLLSDSLRGNTFSLQRWPQDETPLSRTERIELQELLSAQGFETGGNDGIIGMNSRKAIRDFQLQHDLPADGYPSAPLLEKLRSTVQE